MYLSNKENYQPWEESRPFSSTSGFNVNFKTQDDPVSNTDHPNTLGELKSYLDESYHGFGIIGGIMMFDLQKIKKIDWDFKIQNSFRLFLEDNLGKHTYVYVHIFRLSIVHFLLFKIGARN